MNMFLYQGQAGANSHLDGFETNMIETLDIAQRAVRWLEEGREIVLATLVEAPGSSPSPVGSMMAICDNGDFLGAVSGGCMEAEIITEALEMMAKGDEYRGLEFDPGGARSLLSGLSCGGNFKVMLQRERKAPFLASCVAGRPFVLATDMDTGERRKITAGDDSFSRRCLAAAQSCNAGALIIKAAGEKRFFVQRFDPPARLILVGAVEIALRLGALARCGGFDVSVIDPRPVFATAARFPGIRRVVAWPDAALESLDLQPGDALAALSHNPEFDDIALDAALKAQCFYVGALGSRKSHGKRLERLKKAGVQEADLERIHGPVGLDIGARTPNQIAVAILAEIIQAQNHAR